MTFFKKTMCILKSVSGYYTCLHETDMYFQNQIFIYYVPAAKKDVDICVTHMCKAWLSSFNKL